MSSPCAARRSASRRLVSRSTSPRKRRTMASSSAELTPGSTSGSLRDRIEDRNLEARRFASSWTRGLAVMERVGCAACHAVPGIDWPHGLAGPSLEGFGASPMIGGRFPNQPDVLTAWLIDAPSLSPETGMPPMPLSEAEARDVAAYLYTLDDR